MPHAATRFRLAHHTTPASSPPGGAPQLPPTRTRDAHDRDEDTYVVEGGLSNITTLEGGLSQLAGIVGFSAFLGVFFIVPQILIAIGLPIYFGQEVEWCWERLAFGNECGSMEVYVDIDGSSAAGVASADADMGAADAVAADAVGVLAADAPAPPAAVE